MSGMSREIPQRRYDTPADNLSFTPWLRTLGRRYLSVLGAGKVVSFVSAGRGG